MSLYNQQLQLTKSQLELFRVFALLNKFKLIPVRQIIQLDVPEACSRAGARVCVRVRGRDYASVERICVERRAWLWLDPW